MVKKYRPVLIAALILSLLAGACGALRGDSGGEGTAPIAGTLPASGPAAAPVEGAPAPDFELQSLSGESVRLSDLHGRPVLVNFWATWCAPCRIEMPAIQDRFEALQPELEVLAINFDESAEQAQGFVDELGLTFPILLDPGGDVNRNTYRVRGYPSSFFVNADGVIEVVHIGIMTEEQLDGYLSEVGLQP